MDISKSLIINNFEWILAQQTAVDILKIHNLHHNLAECSNIIKDLDIPDIHTSHNEYSLEKNREHPYYSLFKLFYHLNEIQENQNTYLPNLVGIYLIMNIVKN